jgi:DNA-binding NarL/FixJ family response regulator
VRLLLSDKRQWDICGEAKDGAEAIDKVIQLSPDVVILDLTMPVMNGYETAVQIRRVAPSTRIVFYSIHDIPTIARLAGADAFVSKSSAAEDLLSTLGHVLELDRDRPSA